MELTGTLHAILDTETITLRNGGEMKKRVIVLEYDGQFPKKAAFVCQVDSVLGFIETIKNKIGSTVNVKFNVESREWNGKWFTDLKIWRVELVGESVNSPTPSEPEMPVQSAPTSITQMARQQNQDSHPSHDPDYDSGLPF